MALITLLCLGAVSATDINETNDVMSNDLEQTDIADVDGGDEDVDDGAEEIIPTSAKVSSPTVYIQNTNFDIQILDGNGSGIANKTVHVNYKDRIFNKTTDKNGHVYLKLYAKGTYTLSYLFNETGYVPISQSKVITIVGDSTSKLQGSNYVAYVGANNPYTVTLSAGGIKLPNKKVIFTVKGKKYTRTTDSKGKATLNINLKKGTYTVKYAFNGVTNAKATKGSSKITVKKGMPTKLVKTAGTLRFNEKTSHVFKFKYLDVRGKPIASKTIVFKVNKKTYTKKTDKNGMVTFTVKLNKGNYKTSVNSYNTNVYKSSSKSYTLKVRPSYTMNNGFWLFGYDMKDVKLKNMAKNGVNNIFLNYYAVELHGKTAVSNFAKQAGKLGIKVHIWMLTFYNGNWVSPVNKDGSYKYSLFNSIIKRAKSYADIEGIDGIHFDYLRFPGTAQNHKNGASAISYFTKKACDELHKKYPGIIVSAAVMAEPSGMKYYYGQDIPTISKYLDVIVPMVYKGNYHQGTSWIKSTTSAFVGMSNGAQIWTGLQGYYSDSNVRKLPLSNIKNDAYNAMMGGAHGLIVFRYTLFNMFDFNSV